MTKVKLKPLQFCLIICTYQRPQALVDLLNSVTKQTVYPNQILIIDGSLDTQTEVVLQAQQVQNLEYYRVSEADRGLTRQRNFGIEKLNPEAEIVCFLDDDVILKSDYFEHLLKTFEDKSDAVGVGGFITNEVSWLPATRKSENNWFVYDGYKRKEGSRFTLRSKFGLSPDVDPGYMPSFGHGRSISFLPPSGKTYAVEQLMGGVAAYKTSLFENLEFSNYFEGYSLYEDADFSLRASKLGSLWINTKARLEHHHDPLGRPDLFKYGKMVIRNGWYVWRVKYPNPDLKSRFKWNATSLLLTLIRFSNVITTKDKKGALLEASGRVIGWFTLLYNKPKVE